MKSVSEFPKALKIFAKEVVVPEAIISDSHKCQNLKEVRQFCHKIGTTLHMLKDLSKCTAQLYDVVYVER